ncbi:two-component response regulator-like PRR1 [Solanum dulcamara]|uniref:two-component response regulator-like PRR1 n=1 Tax=Solanum dulcamara TaxID=45834 RepID=UPI002484F4E5|nr:two-component response regulator-like PRR1 [Solanum dulcamara]
MPSPLNDQILNFCESELFSEIQNSDVASSSNNCCYDEQSSYSTTTTTNFDLNKFQNNGEKNDETITKTATSTTDVSPDNVDYNNNMSIIFDTQDEIDNDISASIDITPSANFTVPDHFLQQQEEQFDVNPLNNHHGSVIPLSHQYHSLMGPPLGHVYEDESLSSIPPYMQGLASTSSTSPCHALIDRNMINYLKGNLNNTMNSEASAIFAAAAHSALFFGSQLLPNQELDFQGENGRIFRPDSLSRIYNNELQALSNESQHLVSGAGCSNTLATEITSFEDPTFKSGRCSVEARREKIHRYMKKRNERNFSKKIKYACRKTLADSRPRVRGRFARNDEFGEASKANSCGTIEKDTISHEDVRLNNIMYHPNMVTSSTHHDNNARIFTSNCHVPTTGPYDMCTPLYCIDGQMH